MSIRSNPRTLNASSSTPSSAIDFKDEFVNSPAALAQSHDETVSHILARLDQLQSKISNQSESTPAQQTTVRTAPVVARKEGGDLHSRLSALETIHETALQNLSSKLDRVERQFGANKEAEALMGQISSKFSAIESRLKGNKEAEALMGQISSKFSAIESRLKENKDAEALMGQISSKFSAIESRLKESKDAEALMSQISSKFSQVESRLQAATRLSDRVAAIEAKHPDLHSRVTKLEAHLTPDPEQERILARINAKLDLLEQNARKSSGSSLGASYDPKPSHSEHDERVKFLQNRIEKLKELRSRYESEEMP